MLPWLLALRLAVVPCFWGCEVANGDWVPMIRAAVASCCQQQSGSTHHLHQGPLRTPTLVTSGQCMPWPSQLMAPVSSLGATTPPCGCGARRVCAASSAPRFSGPIYMCPTITVAVRPPLQLCIRLFKRLCINALSPVRPAPRLQRHILWECVCAQTNLSMKGNILCTWLLLVVWDQLEDLPVSARD